MPTTSRLDTSSKSEATTAFEGRYSRQTLTYGKSAMTKITKARALISSKNGFTGPAIECAKCAIMAGVSVVNLHSSNFRLDYSDLSSNYYASEGDVTPDHADPAETFEVFEKIRSNLSSLNTSVSVAITEYNRWLGQSEISTYDLLVMVDYTVEDNAWFDQICRRSNVKFIAISSHGLMGSIFCDFLNHTIVDPDGVPNKTGVIQTIKDGVFTTAEPHQLSTGTAVKFTKMVKSLEDKPYLISVINPKQFQVCAMNSKTPVDHVQRHMYVRENPKFKVIDQIVHSISFEEVKPEVNTVHKSYESYMTDPSSIEFTRMDMVNWDRPVLLLAFHRALSICSTIKTCHTQINYETLRTIFKNEYLLCTNTSSNTKKLIEASVLKVFDLLYQTYTGRVTGVDSVVGAIAAQEMIKAITGKYEPINQFMYFDNLDILPDSYLEDRSTNLSEYADKSNRYDGATRIFGDLGLQDMQVFVVGSGAVGCEHLKNLAMMGVGTRYGKITVTDMDNIELSNLNRQFLFRTDDIGEPKSSTAAKKVKIMNPAVNIEAHTRKVGRETENIYTQRFFEDTDVVLNALDNVHARKYVDSRCVMAQTPLLECGTLGTIGSVQVVVPNVTESYSSFEDAEHTTGIPVCTLRLFPSTFEHVVEFGRSAFESEFTIPQSTYAKIRSDINTIAAMEPTELEKAHESIWTLLSNCKNFKYCIKHAFEVFHKMFRDPILQLVRKYPKDHLTDDGELFWSGSKTYPTPINFDIENQNHLDFIVTYANIWADSVGIPKEKRYTKVGSYKKFIKTLQIPVENKIEEDSAKSGETDTDMLRQQIIVMMEKVKASGILTNLTQIDFEKDDDDHVDFLTSLSALRSSNYSIEPKDRLTVKGIAGKIIPAIATTTSIVSALVSLELYKLAYSKKIKSEQTNLYSTCAKYRYGTFNLASSTYAFGESVPPKVVKVKGRSYTIWTVDSFKSSDCMGKLFKHYASFDHSKSGSESGDESGSESGSKSDSLIEPVEYLVNTIYCGDDLLYEFDDCEYDADDTIKNVISKRVKNIPANGEDIFLDVSICPDNLLDSPDPDLMQKSSVNLKVRIATSS